MMTVVTMTMAPILAPIFSSQLTLRTTWINTNGRTMQGVASSKRPQRSKFVSQRLAYDVQARCVPGVVVTKLVRAWISKCRYRHVQKGAREDMSGEELLRSWRIRILPAVSVTEGRMRKK